MLVTAYFVDEDRAFTPRGYLSVCQSIILCAEKWHTVNLSEYINFSNLEPSLHEFINEDKFRDHENILINTWKKLRAYLYDDTISSRVIRSDTGQAVEIPSYLWGSSKADAVLVCGALGDSFQTTEFDGRAVISETDLNCVLNGISKPTNGGPPVQSLVILAPSDPETTSAYLPLGYIGIKEAFKAFHDKAKALEVRLISPVDAVEQRHKLYNRAEKELIAALSSGTLPSFHIEMGEGTVRALNQSDWLPGGPILKSVTSDVVCRYPGGWYDKFAIKTHRGDKLGVVSVSAEDLLRVLRGNSSARTTGNSQSKSPSTIIQLSDKGGRPPSYDGELFLIEAAKVILDGVPETQSQLIERALDAYEAACHPGGRPSSDWAKLKIRPLWRRLGLGKKG